jgi:vancomycin resistance protein YoaR
MDGRSDECPNRPCGEPAIQSSHSQLPIPIPVLVVLLIGVLLIGERARLEALYNDRIYPGVAAAGVDLGGLTVAEATARLTSKLDTYASTALAIRANGALVQATPASLGFRSDAATRIAQESFKIGRTSDLPNVVLGPLAARQLSTPLVASDLVDDGALTSGVARMATRIDRGRTDARLVLSPAPRIEPSHVGQKVDRSAAIELIRSRLVELRADPIDLSVVSDQPRVTTAQLQPVLDRANRIVNRDFVLVDGAGSWPVPKGLVQSALVPTADSSGLDVQSEALAPFVKSLANQVQRPAQDARLDLAGGNTTVVPEQLGRRLNVADTLTDLRAAILAENSIVPLRIVAIPPDVRATDLQPLADQASAAIKRGLVLVANGKTYPVAASDLGDMLTILRDGSNWSLALNRDGIAAVVHKINGQYIHPSLDARFGWQNGSVVIPPGPIPVAMIDESGAVTAVLAGWQRGQVDLPVVASTVPTLDPSIVAGMQADLHEVLQDRETSFAGSIPERASNIALALSKINGTYVAPGELFSFNHVLGPTTIAAGFRWGFAYAPGDTGVGFQVVPSVGGGICQVATTLFQPVFWTGYTIEERHWHTFAMHHYADKGYLGLDATVFPEANVDLRFRNDSDHGLLILAGTNGANAKITLVGTRPDWTVSVPPEVDSNVVPAPTAVDRTTSPVFAKGRQIILEEAQPGVTTEVVRHVTYPDGHVRTLDLKSTYVPAPLSILVGTG